MKNYIKRHWRGELSLAKAFWVNGALLGMAMNFLFGVFNYAGLTDGMHWQARVAVVILLPAILITVGVWQIVGIWRSAENYTRSKFLPFLVKFIMGMNALALVVTPFAILAQLQILLGGILTPTYQVDVSDDRKTLLISGEINLGISDDIEQLLEQHRGVTRVQLSSIGGDLDESYRVQDIIQLHRLDTYVEDYCYSACTLVFIAGRNRVISSDAVLGFHQYEMSLKTRESDAMAQRMQNKDAVYFRNRGVTQAFTNKMFQAANDDMWEPTREELLQAGVVHRIHNIVEEELLNLPAFQIIAARKPAEFQQLVEEIDAVPRDEDAPDIVAAMVQNFTLNMRIEALASAPDKLVIENIRQELAMYKALNAAQPLLCVQALYPQNFGFVSSAQLAPYIDQAAADQLLLDVLESGLGQPTAIIDYTPAEDDLVEILMIMGERADPLRTDIPDNTEGYRAHCASLIELYETAFSSLPYDRQVNLVRYLTE